MRGVEIERANELRPLGDCPRGGLAWNYHARAEIKPILVVAFGLHEVLRGSDLVEVDQRVSTGLREQLYLLKRASGRAKRQGPIVFGEGRIRSDERDSDDQIRSRQ